MPQRVAAVACALGAALLLAHVGDALALSLGRMQGVATIGQPLHLSLPFSIATGEEAPCIRADLLQGDTPGGRLDWRIDILDDERRMLRLSSQLPVVEPIITVNLSIGCAQPFARGFVLLAEPPATLRQSAPLPPRPEPPPPVTRNADGWNVETGLGKASRAAVAPARAPAKPSPRATAGRRAAPSTTPTGDAPHRSGGSGRPRLSLELMDVALDQAATLKASGELASPGAPGALPRAEAAAAWKALNTPPTPEVAQALQVADDLERRQLRALAQRQAEQLTRLGRERDLVRDILAGLAGAVALGLGVLLWRRTRDPRRGGAWWDEEREQPVEPGQHPRPEAAPRNGPALPLDEIDSDWSSMASSSHPRSGSPAPPRSPPHSQVSSQSHPPTHSPSLPATLHVGLPTTPHSTTAPVPSPVPGFADSVLGRGRLPSAEELLDVQERANFFIAISQHDEAIDLLETRLMEHYGTSPFLWLDLLDLCRKLDRPVDYERVRKRFQKAFAARLPGFEAQPEESEGLERYPRALSRITLLWPTRKVLKEIEKSLFEGPAEGAILFDLEASRELLLLYSIASEVVDEVPAPGPSDVAPQEDILSTQPVPLIDLDLSTRAPAPDQGLNLDVDFASLEPASGGPTPLPSLVPTALLPLALPLAPLDDIPPAPAPSALAAPTQAPVPAAGLDLDLDLDALVPGRFR